MESGLRREGHDCRQNWEQENRVLALGVAIGVGLTDLFSGYLVLPVH